MLNSTEQNGLLQKLMDVSPYAFVVLSSDTQTLLRWNTTFQALCPLPPSMGKALDDLGFHGTFLVHIAEQQKAYRKARTKPGSSQGSSPDLSQGSTVASNADLQENRLQTGKDARVAESVETGGDTQTVENSWTRVPCLCPEVTIWYESQIVHNDSDETVVCLRPCITWAELVTHQSGQSGRNGQSGKNGRNGQNGQNWELDIDTLPTMVSLHDARGRFLFSNKACAEFLGLPAWEVANTNVFALLKEEGAQQLQKTIKRCLNDNSPQHTMIDYVRPDGTRQVHLSMRPIPESGDSPEAALLVCTDVTEYTSVENNEHFHRRDTLLGATSQAAQLLLSDSDFFDVTVNSVLEILGHATQVDRVYVWSIHASPNPEINPELHTTQLYEWSLGAEPQQDLDICTNRPVSEAIPTWIDTFKSGKCVNNLVKNMPLLEQEQLAPQGIVSIMTAPIMFHGELWGFIGFDDCHSEYQWSESEENILRTAGTLVGTAIRNQRVNEALRESQARFSMVEEATGEIIWSLDKKYRFDYMSDRVTAVLGYTPAELLGDTCIDWFLGNKRDDFFKHSPALPIIRDMEHVVQRKDGTSCWLRSSCKFLFDAAGSIVEVFGSSMDITEMREASEEVRLAKIALENANRQLAQTAEMAQRANKSKGEFLANMSHEIRTPMNAIMGMVQFALRTDLTPKQREYLQQVDFASKSLLRIINDILDFSKIEAGKLDIENVSFFVPDIVYAVSDLVRQRADEKRLALVISVQPDIQKQYFGDPLRLSQVLTNLATNAIKFTSEGNITISVKAQEQSETEDVLLFSVADTGIGITPEQQKKLFRPFSQADTSITRLYGGTGLGLVLCKKLVELMGGTIWYDSVPGEGSTFYFTVRLQRATVEEYEGNTPQNFKDMYILLADSHVSRRQNLHSLLKDMGCGNIAETDSVQGVLGLVRDDNGRGQFNMVLLSSALDNFSSFEKELLDAGQNDRLLEPEYVIISDNYEENKPLQAFTESLLVRPISQSILYDTLMKGFASFVSKMSQQEEQEREASLMNDFTGCQVLLVEDNEINQMVAEELLVQAGLEVSIAENGEKALELVDKGNFDIVLMDIQMPVMDGLTAAMQIRSQRRFDNLPIIAMTAHAMSDDMKKSLDAGMNAHISKPINSIELFTHLAEWLRKRRQGKL